MLNMDQLLLNIENFFSHDNFSLLLAETPATPQTARVNLYTVGPKCSKIPTIMKKVGSEDRSPVAERESQDNFAAGVKDFLHSKNNNHSKPYKKSSELYPSQIMLKREKIGKPG